MTPGACLPVPRSGAVAVTTAGTEVVRGDCLDAASLDAALAGIDTAYYLVHSMGSGADFAAQDRRAAVNFGRAAARAGVRRIIYLGGLADDVASLSPHLRSRAETGGSSARPACRSSSSAPRSSSAPAACRSR